MGLQLVGLLTGYGFGLESVVVCLALVTMLQALVMALLPPVLAMVVLTASPVFWGHPIFAVWEVSPVHGAAAVTLGAGIIALLSIRRTAVVGICLYTLCWVALVFGVSTSAKRVPILGLATAFTSRSVLPATDWGGIARKVGQVQGRDLLAVALPESTIENDRTRAAEYFRGVADLVGVSFLIGDSTKTGQEILLVRPDRSAPKVVYRQRVPILGVDWMPWKRSGAVPDFWNSGVKPVALAPGRTLRLGFLICYESYLALPWAETIAAAPAAVVVVANDRWSRRSAYPLAASKIRAAATRASGAAIIFAENR
ncbi:hypothetical protein [Solirhodobacter olei]|uniref:hypothetical protein n=1 Tax=Solirhodobacter olei TaxID=2493082 RepID=UPI000FDC1850|nr:hypothetical protein [Solirhodobacter olei]